MKKIYLMTAVTMVVAGLSRMRAAEAFGPDAANLRERLHSAAGKFFRRVRRMINDWVAGAIAYRARRVAPFALRNLPDGESGDFDVRGGSGGSALHRYRNAKFTTWR